MTPNIDPDGPDKINADTSLPTVAGRRAYVDADTSRTPRAPRIGDDVVATLRVTYEHNGETRARMVRGEVIDVVEESFGGDATVVLRDADGRRHLASAGACFILPPAPLDAERLRRLHEIATARAAALRIALEAIAASVPLGVAEHGSMFDALGSIRDLASAALAEIDPEPAAAGLIPESRFESTAYYEAKPHKASGDLVAALAEARGETER